MKGLTLEFLKKYIKPEYLERYNDFAPIFALISEDEFIQTQSFFNSKGLAITKLSHIKLCVYDKTVLSEKIEYAKSKNKYRAILNDFLEVLYVDADKKVNDNDFILDEVTVQTFNVEPEVLSESVDLDKTIINNNVEVPTVDTSEKEYIDVNKIIEKGVQYQTLTEEQFDLISVCRGYIEAVITDLKNSKVMSKSYNIDNAATSLIANGYTDLYFILASAFTYPKHYENDPLTAEEEDMITSKVMQVVNTLDVAGARSM